MQRLSLVLIFPPPFQISNLLVQEWNLFFKKSSIICTCACLSLYYVFFTLFVNSRISFWRWLELRFMKHVWRKRRSSPAFISLVPSLGFHSLKRKRVFPASQKKQVNEEVAKGPYAVSTGWETARESFDDGTEKHGVCGHGGQWPAIHLVSPEKKPAQVVCSVKGMR